MKKSIFLLILAVLALLLVQTVSAASIEEPNVRISPDQKVYVNNEQITISTVVKVTSSTTFPDSHIIRVSTDLANAEWDYKILINGRGEPQTMSGKQRIDVSGWLLSYPTENTVSVDVVVSGKIPSATSGNQITALKVEQLDGAYNSITGGTYEKKLTIVNPDDINNLRSVVETELSNLLTSITEKTSSGISVSEAQAKYNSAYDMWIKSATASYADASTYLNNARELITEANNNLLKSWSENSIVEAENTIGKVNSYITDFKVNRSMGNDARVINIETKVESAQSSLNSAKSLQNEGQYAQAYTLAETADQKASEALTISQELYTEVSKGIIPDMGGNMIYIIIGVVVVLLIVGIVFYKRKTSWDELG